MIARLRELLAEASLLPWTAVTREALKGWPIGFECGDDDDGNWAVSIFGRHASEGATRGAGNDARLIAAAVNALPALLDRLEAAEAVVAAAREESRSHGPIREVTQAEWDAGTRLRAALRRYDEVRRG